MPRTTLLALRARIIGRGLLQPKTNTGVSLDHMLGIFLWVVSRMVGTYTFAMHRADPSTANLPPTTSSTRFSMPSSICVLIMFARHPITNSTRRYHYERQRLDLVPDETPHHGRQPHPGRSGCVQIRPGRKVFFLRGRLVRGLSRFFASVRHARTEAGR